MIARHTATYVGSRGAAAALNLASVAVFTRLAPADTYGTYLYLLSWALVLYAATCQWPKFAFFALYDETRAAVQVGTVVRLLVGTLAAVGAGLLAAAWFGLMPAPTAAAILAIVAGATLFEGSIEIARTRLHAGTVAVAVVGRAALMLGLGSLALGLSHDPVHLALALALANAVAAIPTLRVIAPLMGASGSRAEAGRLLAYGWPLILSFATASLAATLDRLIVGHAVGAAELGAYGAIADFLRQSFVVFGEALTLSLISLAKREARGGDWAAASTILADTARAMTLVAAFGAVFLLAFDDVVVGLLLGPAYRAEAQALAPILILASILMMFRAYYFGQVIYFTRTSHLEAVAALVTLAVVGGVCLVLVPRLGVMGAAIAFAAGQGSACLVFLLGERIAGADAIAMPLPLADLAGISGAALVCGLLLGAIGQMQAGGSVLAQVLRLCLLAATVLFIGWRYDIVGLRGAIRVRLRTAP